MKNSMQQPMSLPLWRYSNIIDRVVSVWFGAVDETLSLFGFGVDSVCRSDFRDRDLAHAPLKTAWLIPQTVMEFAAADPLQLPASD